MARTWLRCFAASDVCPATRPPKLRARFAPELPPRMTRECFTATLKPANVMLDGRGEVLITDFGLAGVAHEIDDVRSGTPAYMAPEQLAGEEVTVKSDIYSLGLLLYEVFTGKAAFDGRTLEEIVRRASRQHSRAGRPRW